MYLDVSGVLSIARSLLHASAFVDKHSNPTCNLHFTDEDTEAQRGEVTQPGSFSKRQSQDVNLGPFNSNRWVLMWEDYFALGPVVAYIPKIKVVRRCLGWARAHRAGSEAD